MTSRGQGHKGRPRGTSPPPLVFDPQAFMETMGAIVATIIQAGVTGGYRGISNLRRFRAHHPPTFRG